MGHILSTVIVGDKVDGLAIGREARLGGHAVEALGEDFRLAAVSGRDSNMLRRVVEKLEVHGSRVGDPLSIGRPSGMFLLAGKIGDLHRVGALVGVVGEHHPDV